MSTDATKKTPTRPGSQWATGKRRRSKTKGEPKGFFRGAVVHRRSK